MHFSDLNVAVTELTVLAVFHPDARDLFNICSDLKKVAQDLWNPEIRLDSEVLP